MVRNWLSTVASQDLLQPALLADPADDSLVLVRIMDREQLDLATLHATVANFVARVDSLFKRGGRMAVESTFPSPSNQAVKKVHLEDVHVGRIGKGGGGGKVPRLLGGH